MARVPKIVWVASYPKSGNTWLRFLLINLIFGPQDSTADFETLLPDIHEGIDLAKFADRPRLFVKSHFRLASDMPLFRRTEAFIYVVRHPLDVMLSNLNYHQLTHAAGKRLAEERDPATVLNEHVSAFLAYRGDPRWFYFGFGNWINNVESWLHNEPGLPGLILRYDRLWDSTAEEVARICDFLELDVDRETRDAAISASSFKAMRALEENEVAERTKGFFWNPQRESGVEAGLRFDDRGHDNKSKFRLTRAQEKQAIDVFRPAMTRLGLADLMPSARVGG